MTGLSAESLAALEGARATAEFLVHVTLAELAESVGRRDLAHRAEVADESDTDAVFALVDDVDAQARSLRIERGFGDEIEDILRAEEMGDVAHQFRCVSQTCRAVRLSVEYRDFAFDASTDLLVRWRCRTVDSLARGAFVLVCGLGESSALLPLSRSQLVGEILGPFVGAYEAIVMASLIT